MNRPPVPFEAPEGFHWNVRPAEDWTAVLKAITVTPRCRYYVDGKGHGAPIVAALRRGKPGRTHWWGYCAEHLYGRWIDPEGVFEGRVVEFVLRPDTTPKAAA